MKPHPPKIKIRGPLGQALGDGEDEEDGDGDTNGECVDCGDAATGAGVTASVASE